MTPPPELHLDPAGCVDVVLMLPVARQLLLLLLLGLPQSKHSTCDFSVSAFNTIWPTDEQVQVQIFLWST